MCPFINPLAVQQVDASEDVATQVALVNVHMFAARKKKNINGTPPPIKQPFGGINPGLTLLY